MSCGQNLENLRLSGMILDLLMSFRACWVSAYSEGNARGEPQALKRQEFLAPWRHDWKSCPSRLCSERRFPRGTRSSAGKRYTPGNVIFWNHEVSGGNKLVDTHVSL